MLHVIKVYSGELLSFVIFKEYVVSVPAQRVFSLDYSKIWPSGLNVSILFHFPAARWLIVLPKGDYSPGWHSSWDLLFNTRDHQHLPKQVIPLCFLFCVAFLCQMICVNSRDLKLVFQGSDVLFLKKNNFVRSSAWVFPVFILFSPCVICFPVGIPAFPQRCDDMEHRRYPSITWVPCC